MCAFIAQNEASADQPVSQNSIGKDATSADNDRDHAENGVPGDSGTNADNVFLVIYLVDAFLYGQQTSAADVDDSNASRLAMIGLLQCYTSMLKAIPEHLHSCIQLQVGSSMVTMCCRFVHTQLFNQFVCSYILIKHRVCRIMCLMK